MALSLANMLTRVKQNVPTTTMDTELQDKLLERMNYLVSLDMFPFQEKYQSDTLAAGSYNMATPDNFAAPKSIVIWAGDDKEREIILLDALQFSKAYPKPDERIASTPCFACIRIAEGELWFNCPADVSYTVRIEFFAIPDDATDLTISQLTELAKLALIDWASADGFRMMGQHDNANEWENQGDKKFAAMEKRYQRALEKDARFISPQLAHAMKME